MIKSTKKIELLAPAKDKECALAAIKAGADAIYIGAASYGARKNAGNSLEDIKEIVEYAHKFFVKIYVTLNTILFNNEVKEVEKLVWKLYKIGADAIIFQDFSFFEMDLPQIALHASTQCNNDSLEKIKFLKKMNVERVVLPREYSLTEIKEVVDNIDIETEVFIHGALCVSYSGQCYMSNHIGGRSANRGECAQPCRKKYSLIDNKGNTILKEQYLLSMKDNNQSAHIQELIDAGVTSLKIEGRLKDKDYVANVTAYYRKIIDEISADLRPSCGILTNNNFIPNVNKTFNRKYTDFFIDGKRKCFINPLTPKFTGELVGTAKTVSGNKIKISEQNTIKVSDKLCYFSKNNEISGTTVTKSSDKEIEVLNIGKIKAGTKLYRNFDYDFNKSLNNANFERKLPLKLEISVNKIKAETINGISTELKIPCEYEKANNIEKAKETVIKQFLKLGDTDFVCFEVTVSNDFNLFIPVSKLNELRRNTINMIEEKMKQAYQTTKREIPKTYPEYPIHKIDYSFNVSNETAKDFYNKCKAEVTEYAPEHTTPKKEIILMKTKHCLRDIAGICTKNQKHNKQLYLLDEYGNKYPLKFNCKNCIMEIYSSTKQT